jgi:2-polyprenyl-3-methyl-5-hydroxy-6-metoxy-1,4-benzoquinol methylase
VTDRLASGDYARKQIYCPSRVVAWSHGSRFKLAARLAASGAGGRLLDYGCGDGTFLALTHGTFAEAVGADVDARQLDDCRRRFQGLGHVGFVATADLANETHAAAYDVVTCMEVLEHCVEATRVRVLQDLGRAVAPRGRVIISAPIEVGPALLGKQAFRAIAAWRRQGDYQHRETYSPAEMLAAVVGTGRVPHVEYHVEGPEGPRTYRGHKGFDWRVLAREIEARFLVEARLFSPLPLLGAVLNSQVWFVCRHPTR